MPYKNHRDKLAYMREYNNKLEIKERARKYYKVYHKEYYKKNKDKYKKYQEEYLKNPEVKVRRKKYNEDKQFLDWLSGFVDGEGCFTILCRAKNGKKSLSVSFVPALSIELKLYDYKILEKIGRFLKRTDIKFMSKERKDHRTYYLKVCSLIQCKKLFPLFDNKLKTQKRKDYLIWKKIILFQISKKSYTYTDKELLFIAGLRDKMNCNNGTSKKISNYITKDKLKSRFTEYCIVHTHQNRRWIRQKGVAKKWN